jgi:thioredoxin-dependent peroxiredoxin
MRSFIYFLAVTTSIIGVSALAVSPAQAQQVRGMKKHDASIAAYNYSVQIQTGEDPGNGNLKDDLDAGKTTIAPASSSAFDSVPGTVKPLRAPSSMNAVSAATPLSVGAQAPEFTLPNNSGKTLSLKTILNHGPALILFVPSASSPQVELMQRNLKQFDAVGVNIIGISPGDVISQNLGFNMLKDQNNDVSRQYGVVQGYVPMPTLFSIDATGTIAAVQIQQNPNTVFDLKVATDALVSQPAAEAAPQVKAAPAAVKSAPKAPMISAPAPISAAPMDEQQGELLAPIIPAVPSAQAGKVKYDVPPSSPEFGKTTNTQNSKSI